MNAEFSNNSEILAFYENHDVHSIKYEWHKNIDIYFTVISLLIFIYFRCQEKKKTDTDLTIVLCSHNLYILYCYFVFTPTVKY